MNKPRIISIGYGRHLFVDGNTERVRLEKCAAGTAGLHLIIFSLSSDGINQQTAQSGLQLYPTNSSSRWLMLMDAFFIARKIINDSKAPTVVTTQDPFAAGLVGLFLQKILKVSLVVQEHGDVFGAPYWRSESLFNRGMYWVGKCTLRQADRVRVVAARVSAHVQSLGVPLERIVSLPVAIDAQPFIPKSFRAPIEPNQTFTFVTVARFVPQKNFPLMLQAFHIAWIENNHIRLIIVGSGPAKSQILSTIDRLYDVHNCPVTLINWSDDVPSLMQQADAYLLTSNYEGWARVLIEAMIAQLPVVTTDVGCVGEVLLDGVHGLVVPVSDVSRLAQSILTMSTNKNQYQEFVTNLQQLKIDQIPGADMDSYSAAWVETFNL
jgi:glycosyltransferase involved in cell wall biosynthesis